MIAIGHTSVGIILGVAASELLSPDLPLPLEVVVVGLAGLVSHYAMDLLPHGHYNFNQKNLSSNEKFIFSLDFILPIGLIGIFLLSTHGLDRTSWLVSSGILGAQLPDILMGMRNKKLLPNWHWLYLESVYHSRTHWHNPTNPSKATNQGGRKLNYSDIWQAVMVVIAAFLILH